MLELLEFAPAIIRDSYVCSLSDIFFSNCDW